MKQPEPLPYERAPGVFAAADLTPASFDNLYNCRSYHDGDSASLPEKGVLEYSGYMGMFFSPKTPRQHRDRKVAEALQNSFHPAYQRTTEEASRVANLAYYDSSVSGYIGELINAQRGFENTSKAWKKYTTEADERRAQAELFLKRHTYQIIGLEGYFEGFVFESDAAVSSLKQVAQSIKVRTVTQRRLNVYESGAYIASRRGNIWAAINDSGMSDMPYFNFAAPLAGLALLGVKKQHTANYKKHIITPVVIGKDGAPYLAPNACSTPFTLRPSAKIKP